MITLRKVCGSVVAIILIPMSCQTEAANNDLCTKIIAATSAKTHYGSPVERTESDVNNVGQRVDNTNVYVGDDVYIKRGTQAWKKARIAKSGETRDHTTRSFGKNAKCEDVGVDVSFRQPTHLFHVTVFNDRNKPSVYIALTTDAGDGEPLAEEIEWLVPEPKYFEQGQPRTASIRWNYGSVQIPTAEIDLTSAPWSH